MEAGGGEESHACFFKDKCRGRLQCSDEQQ